ncbi:hypothetical protein [Hoeflea sp.]|uniref:hypothetical protein n=1 Tax=Hoeflea sp. TaxID=1940281 RepID=UPI0037490FD5
MRIMVSSRFDACEQVDFLLNPKLRKGKRGEMREILDPTLGFDARKPGEMTCNFCGPERFSENAMDLWLAVRNFFRASSNGRFDHFGGFPTASMFNKIANLPSV